MAWLLKGMGEASHDLLGLPLRVVALILACINAGLLGHPGFIESFGLIAPAVGIPMQAAFLVAAFRIAGPGLVRTLMQRPPIGWALVIITSLSLAFSIGQLLTLSGLVAPGILIIE